MRKPSLLIIFLTVFIDLIGFGIVVPMVPVFSRHFGAHGLVIGVIVASFSAMQFVFAPIWGRLSDRLGRRPMLLISTFGAGLSYVLFAVSCGLETPATALWLMVLSRVFAGICGGNITVAQAYIADISTPEQRSKRMGLIGVAFGLGFIFGPIIGGVSLKHGGITAPGWVAAGLCAANFLLALFILRESRQPGSVPAGHRPALRQWVHTLTKPRVGLLVMVFFLATFAFSCFETTLPLLVTDNFNLHVVGEDASASTVIYLYAYCGIISVFIQGGAIGPLVKRWGEARLIAASLVITAASFVALPFLRGDGALTWGVLLQSEGLPWLAMLAVLAALAVGSSLTRPPLFGLLSNLTPDNEQGETIGVAQSAGSLARILGSVFAPTALYYSAPLPYLVCAVLLIGTTVVVLQRLAGHRKA
jgi:MFS family permease